MSKAQRSSLPEMSQSHCVACGRRTAEVGAQLTRSITGQPRVASKCGTCGRNKSRFVSHAHGGGVVQRRRVAASGARRRGHTKGSGFFGDIVGGLLPF